MPGLETLPYGGYSPRDRESFSYETVGELLVRPDLFGGEVVPEYGVVVLLVLGRAYSLYNLLPSVPFRRSADGFDHFNGRSI